MSMRTLFLGALLAAATLSAQLAGLPAPTLHLPLHEGDLTALRNLADPAATVQVRHPERLSWIAGPTGPALYFNNGDEATERGMLVCDLPAGFDLKQGFTLTAMIKTPPALHRSRQYEILSFMDTFGKGPGFRVMVSWRTLWLYTGDGETSAAARSNTSVLGIDPDTWYAIAAVFDGRNSRVYLNGDLLGTTEQVPAAMPVRRKQLHIGASQAAGSGYGFEGSITGLRLFNQPLNAAQIAALSHQE